jgi:hypothetical protein
MRLWVLVRGVAGVSDVTFFAGRSRCGGGRGGDAGRAGGGGDEMEVNADD